MHIKAMKSMNCVEDLCMYNQGYISPFLNLVREGLLVAWGIRHGDNTCLLDT